MGLKDEIFEQPAVLRRWLATQMDAVRRFAAATRGRQIDYVFLAARGTSDHAGIYAAQILALSDEALRQRLLLFKERLAQEVARKNEKLRALVTELTQ